LYLDGQAYTITRQDDSTVTITSSDYATKVAVFPYLELVNGEDHRFAYTDEVTIFTDAINGTSSDKTIQLPTGDVAVTFTNSTAGDCSIAFAVTGGSTYTITNATAGGEDGITVGSVDYVVNATDSVLTDSKCTAVDVTIALEAAQTADAQAQETDPAILFVEDEDKSMATTTTKNAVILATSDDGTYSTSSAPVFTTAVNVGYATAVFDNTDYTGYITNFGTYILKDASDDHQAFTSLTYQASPMYADVIIADSGATTSTSSTALQPVLDTDTAAITGKNLIVVGGSCVNTVAAKLLGLSAPTSTSSCLAAFTTATSAGAGQFVIQSFDAAQAGGTAGKVALLVAGYAKEDTQKASTYLVNKVVDTTASKKYIGTSATEASLVTA
jgi:hypothetical protein